MNFYLLTNTGDSGSPILQWIGNRWQQVGVFSSLHGECGAPDYHSFYVRLVTYLDWIVSIFDANKEPKSLTLKPSAQASKYVCNKTQVSCGCGQENVDFTSARIQGGQQAVPYSWSMMASVHLGASVQYACGGTIIDASHILTAAFCVQHENQIFPKLVYVLVGFHNWSDLGVTVRKVDRIYMHPQWNEDTDPSLNNIAILHLSTPLSFANDPRIFPTCIPPAKLSTPAVMQYPPNGTQLAVIGWGSAGSNTSESLDNLQQAMIYLIDDDDPTCSAVIKDKERQFCAGLYEGGKGQSFDYGVQGMRPLRVFSLKF